MDINGLEKFEMNLDIELDNSDDGKTIQLTINADMEIEPDDFVLILRAFADRIDTINGVSEEQMRLPN